MSIICSMPAKYGCLQLDLTDCLKEHVLDSLRLHFNKMNFIAYHICPISSGMFTENRSISFLMLLFTLSVSPLQFKV